MRICFAVALTFAASAFADEPPPAEQPPVATAQPPPPDLMAAPWSVGAGLSTTGVSVVSTLGLLGSTLIATVAPTATVSIERRLTPKTSLIGGLQMSANTTNSQGSLSLGVQSVALALGVRHVFIGDPQLVAVSGDVALSFGYARTELIGTENLGSGEMTIHSVSNQGSVQLLGGFSVEHLLMQQLSVRINVRVVGAGFNAGRGASLVAAETSNTGFNVSIGVSPGIELRMYF
jgi:hypothetical protein